MNVFELAIKKYGVDRQLFVACEEFSELIKELSKAYRGIGDTRRIVEEMADCYIMLRQLELIFDINYSDIVMVRNNKIHRLFCQLEDDSSSTNIE